MKKSQNEGYADKKTGLMKGSVEGVALIKAPALMRSRTAENAGLMKARVSA